MAERDISPAGDPEPSSSWRWSGHKPTDYRQLPITCTGRSRSGSQADSCYVEPRAAPSLRTTSTVRPLSSRQQRPLPEDQARHLRKVLAGTRSSNAALTRNPDAHSSHRRESSGLRKSLTSLALHA